MEQKECEYCKEKIELVDGEYSCITSKFEQDKNKNYIFLASAGYNAKAAADFITDIRLMGSFGVVIKVEDLPKLKKTLEFKQLLELDAYLETI